MCIYMYQGEKLETNIPLFLDELLDEITKK